MTCDEDGLGFEVWAGVEEILRDENGCGAPVGCGATLELGEGFVDHGCLHDLFEGVNVFELGVWVSLGVFVVDAGDFSEVLCLGSVPEIRADVSTMLHYRQ